MKKIISAVLVVVISVVASLGANVIYNNAIVPVYSNQQGLTAYDIAVQNGFDGTVEEWLKSLAGQTGSDGKSAYDLAVENGFNGTVEEWLVSLVGKDGANGKDGVNGKDGADGKDGVDGKDGANGKDGTNGKDGVDGKDGINGKDGADGKDGTNGKSAYDYAVENGFNGSYDEWLEMFSDVFGGDNNQGDNNQGDNNQGDDGDEGGMEGGTPGTAFDEVVDLKGYKFVMTSPYILNDPDLSTLLNSEIVLEEMRHEIEKDYNCSIEVVSYSANLSTFRAKVQSGDKIGDIIDITSREIIPIIRAGLLTPLDEVPGIDVMSEYWDAGSRNIATYSDHVWALNFMKPIEARSCIAYNKDVLKKYGVTEDLVQMVKDNKWTWEAWLPMLQKTTKVAADGTAECYGLTSTRSDIFAFNLISANNGKVIESDKNGYVKETLDSPNTVEALEFFFDLAQTYKVYDTKSNAYTAKKFVDGEYAFMHCESWVLTQQVKDIAGDTQYGMLPVPMGPKGTKYTSNCDHMRFFCISRANTDLAKTVPVFNAFGRYIYNYGGEEEWWREDIEMDYFQEGDKDSVDMYLLTLDSACTDYGLTISAIATAFNDNIISRTILKKRSTIAATVNSLHGTFDLDIQEVFNLQS